MTTFGEKQRPPKIGSDRTAWLIIGCVGLAGLVMFVVLVLLLGLFVRGRSSPPGHGPLADGPRPQPWVQCAGAPASESSLQEALIVPDPARVDATDVLPQVRALALRLEPTLELVGIESPTTASEGRYDLTTGLLNYHFEYRCLDSARPPGMDRRQGMVYVLVRDGLVRASRTDVAGGFSDLFPPLLPTPCKTADAWRAAVETGVPNEAAATFDLQRPSRGLDASAMWQVDVPGHPDYRRWVDASTCNHVRQATVYFKDALPPSPGVAMPPPMPPASTTSASGAPSSAPAASATPSSAPEDPLAIKGDLAHVNIVSLIWTAYVLADDTLPDTKLVGIVAWHVKDHGEIDLRPNNLQDGVEIVYQFETLKGRAGDGSVEVHAAKGRFRVELRNRKVIKLLESDFRRSPLPQDPRCPLDLVWRAADLDKDRTYTFRYVNEAAHHAPTPTVWKIEKGTEVVVVDANTCVKQGWK